MLPFPSQVRLMIAISIMWCKNRIVLEVLAALSLRRICPALPRVALWRAFVGDDAVCDVLLQHQEARFQALVLVVMLVFSFNKCFQEGSRTQY
jgi:hypothetical protein